MRNAVIPFDEAQRGRDMMLAADLGETMADVEAAVTALKSNGGKVAVMGYCWGGGLALRAAQKLDIDAAVAFYGTRLPQYLDSPLKAPLMGHFGTNDDHVPRNAGPGQGVSAGYGGPYVRRRSCIRERRTADICRGRRRAGA